MAGIANIQPVSAQKLSGDQWRLTVTYTATFSQFEVNNHNFRDWIQVWEDDPFSDDQLTGNRNVADFNPGSTQVQRTKTTTVSSDTLDTELGAEEIYLKIFLRNVDLGVNAPSKNSAIINLAP